MAAEYSKLEDLHSLITQVFMEEIEYYRKEQIPVPAADKAVIVKFLKDNAVVATPKTTEDLDKLRAELKSSARGSRLAKLRAEIGGDLDSDATVIRLQ